MVFCRKKRKKNKRTNKGREQKGKGRRTAAEQLEMKNKRKDIKLLEQKKHKEDEQRGGI